MLTTLVRSAGARTTVGLRPRVPDLIDRRRTWAALGLGLLLALGVLGGLRGVEGPARAKPAPSTSESARADAALAALPGADVAPVLLVVTRHDGGALGQRDLAAATALGTDVPAAPGERSSPAVPARDGRAAIVQVPVRVSTDDTVNAEVVGGVRDAVASHRPPGLDVLVTGGPAFGADVASSFDGADVRLLLATVGIVALLLLLTYRSPVLWLVPLAVVGLADQLAAAVATALAHATGLFFDAGIVSVLVFGAGTNYALLLISRYREELRRHEDHRVALTVARRATLPAVVASNLTVVLALGALVLTVVPGTRGLGIASAAGLLTALGTVLGLLPPLLAVVGRRAFWPFVPRPSAGGVDADGGPDPRATVFGRVAAAVLRRPVAAVAGSLAVLALLGTGLVGTTLGLDQTQRFRTQTESAAGLEVLSAHYPAGEAQPLTVVTDREHLEGVRRALGAVPGVTRAVPAGDTTLTVVTDATPGTAHARDLVEAVRSAAHGVAGAGALVGGPQATDLDARAGHEQDLWLAVPLVLLVVGLVLLVLLRSVLAPVVLLSVNAASAVGTLGAGSWVGRHLLGWPALDLQVPLLAFLFLVALGIDYTIFLVHRARSEACLHGTRDGMARAVGATGGVITSAGIVLAGVFTALGVLPLVTLGQLGLIVGLGVVLDTFLVRTVLVPAVFGLLGDRVWWPARPPSQVK